MCTHYINLCSTRIKLLFCRITRGSQTVPGCNYGFVQSAFIPFNSETCWHSELRSSTLVLFFILIPATSAGVFPASPNAVGSSYDTVGSLSGLQYPSFWALSFCFPSRGFTIEPFHFVIVVIACHVYMSGVLRILLWRAYLAAVGLHEVLRAVADQCRWILASYLFRLLGLNLDVIMWQSGSPVVGDNNIGLINLDRTDEEAWAIDCTHLIKEVFQCKTSAAITIIEKRIPTIDANYNGSSSLSITGPVGPWSDITSESGFFTSLWM